MSELVALARRIRAWSQGGAAGDDRGDDIARALAAGAARPRVGILGAGAAGLCMAIRLKDLGLDDVTIFEKSDGVGGTWRDNTYPGAACDVPSHLYSFSFAPKTDWSRKFAEQPEILGYFESLVDRFDLGPHLRLGTEVTSAQWSDRTSTWTLTSLPVWSSTRTRTPSTKDEPPSVCRALGMSSTRTASPVGVGLPSGTRSGTSCTRTLAALGLERYTETMPTADALDSTVKCRS